MKTSMSGTLHKQVLRGVLAVSVSMLLSGCVVSSVSSEPPPLALPEQLSTTPASQSNLPDPWWQLFGDSRLDGLMREALANNPDAAIAAARVAQARAGLRISNADR